MTVADEIKRLTSDPGARKLGEYVDKMQAQLNVLEAKVAACCDGGSIARPATPTKPPEAPTT